MIQISINYRTCSQTRRACTGIIWLARGACACWFSITHTISQFIFIIIAFICFQFHWRKCFCVSWSGAWDASAIKIRNKKCSTLWEIMYESNQGDNSGDNDNSNCYSNDKRIIMISIVVSSFYCFFFYSLSTHPILSL